MKKILITLLLVISFKVVSQNETCAFSDGNYHFSIQIIIEDLPLDFDKADFIQHLETNSNISNTEVNHLEDNLIDVYRLFPYSDSEPFNKFLRISTTDFLLDSFLIDFNESIQQVGILCNCAYSDGYYYNYVRLITNEIPTNDFNKTDFINHLETNSNISNSDLNFLNNSIEEVTIGFPSSQTESLQKTLIIISNYDLMLPYLYDFSESLDLVELLCGEPELAINEFNIEDNIKIIPNPVTENSHIIISDKISIEKLIVYDLNGKILINKSLIGTKLMDIRILNLDSGLYFFKFNSSKSSTIKKVIFK